MLHLNTREYTSVNKGQRKVGEWSVPHAAYVNGTALVLNRQEEPGEVLPEDAKLRSFECLCCSPPHSTR